MPDATARFRQSKALLGPECLLIELDGASGTFDPKIRVDFVNAHGFSLPADLKPN
jgi:hypothetical protein